jgi:AraC family transcriptional activator of pobA
MRSRLVPNFQLYGERESFVDPGFVHIETIEHRSRDHGWEIRPHSHETLDQLLILRSGWVEVRIEADIHRLAGPCAIHVPADTVHGFSFSDDVNGQVLTFSADLRGDLQAGQPGSAVLVDWPVASALELEQADRIEPLLALLELECSGHEAGRILAAGWLVGLLLLQVGRDVAMSKNKVSQSDARATMFRRLVDRHFREGRPVAFYANAMAMTERSLTRLCGARFGCAPAAYVHRRIILEARRRLFYGSVPIARIAEELGFTDPSYFTRFYLRMTGELPSAARRLSVGTELEPVPSRRRSL